MHEIEEWLNQAATALGFSLRRKEPEEGRQIVEKAKADFVDGDPRAWWLSLKLPCKQYSSENTRLADLIPKGGYSLDSGSPYRLWFAFVAVAATAARLTMDLYGTGSMATACCARR